MYKDAIINGFLAVIVAIVTTLRLVAAFELTITVSQFAIIGVITGFIAVFVTWQLQRAQNAK